MNALGSKLVLIGGNIPAHTAGCNEAFTEACSVLDLGTVPTHLYPPILSTSSGLNYPSFLHLSPSIPLPQFLQVCSSAFSLQSFALPSHLVVDFLFTHVIETSTWSEIPSVPEKVSSHTTVPLPDGRLLVYGAISPEWAGNIHVLDPATVPQLRFWTYSEAKSSVKKELGAITKAGRKDKDEGKNKTPSLPRAPRYLPHELTTPMSFQVLIFFFLDLDSKCAKITSILQSQLDRITAEELALKAAKEGKKININLLFTVPCGSCLSFSALSMTVHATHFPDLELEAPSPSHSPLLEDTGVFPVYTLFPLLEPTQSLRRHGEPHSLACDCSRTLTLTS